MARLYMGWDASTRQPKAGLGSCVSLVTDQLEAQAISDTVNSDTVKCNNYMYIASCCRLYLLQDVHDSVLSRTTSKKSMPFGQFGGRLLRPDRQCLEASIRLTNTPLGHP